jgi:hypothetical protein
MAVSLTLMRHLLILVSWSRNYYKRNRGTKSCANVLFINVLYPGKGVCADPVNEGAILGKGGAEPHSRDRERQLATDTGRGKT